MKPPQPHVRLDVYYWEDEAIAELSPMAELLYVRGLCMAKRSNGALTASQLRRVADEPDNIGELIAELTTDRGDRHGPLLADEGEGRYRIRATGP